VSRYYVEKRLYINVRIHSHHGKAIGPVITGSRGAKSRAVPQPEQITET